MLLPEQYSIHLVDPKDIIADPELQKPIEEKHPNIQDDAKKGVCLVRSMPTKRSQPSDKENIWQQ
jgi:hypothetical protein